MWRSCERTVAQVRWQLTDLTLLAQIWCRHPLYVFYQAALLHVQQILSIAPTWPPVAVAAAPSVRPTTLARPASVQWMVVAVRREPTWMMMGYVCCAKSVPAMIKTLSLMLERSTAKTASYGKWIESCLHLSHISLIVMIVNDYSYIKILITPIPHAAAFKHCRCILVFYVILALDR